MKILWLTVMSQVIDLSQSEKEHKASGGWIAATAKNLEAYDDIEKFIIVSVNRDNKEEKKVVDDKKIVYFVRANQVKFGRDKVLEEKLAKIIEEERPDVVDVQGTEFSFGESVLNLNLECPVSVTLQGLADSCVKVYTKGMPLKELIFGRAKADNKRFKGILERKMLLYMRALTSNSIIKKSRYCIGRTHFDKLEAKGINKNIKYYSCNRILRDDFYNAEKWNIKNANKHQLFGISSQVPYKGLHYAVKVIAKLKEKYPDVCLSVPGNFKIDLPDSTIQSYEKYIKKLINEYGVRDNIKFLPSLNPSEMIDEMMKCRAFYQYSIIENSPNSLAEAQILGVPCVASDVGGTSSYVEDGKDGLLFKVDSVYECAEKIAELFENDSLCLSLSENGIKTAEERHNVKSNTEKLISIYKDIIAN